MRYEILYQDSFAIVQFFLNKGEMVKAESGAMIAASSAIDISGSAEGGIFNGITRMLAGEKFFFQHLTAKRGAGEVLLGPVVPGAIVDVELDGSYGLRVQKDGFLAATENINVDSKMQNLTKGLFSGEGFFILNITGSGTVFVNSYGAIHAINLEAGQEFIVDNGHLVAWADYMNYKLEKTSSSGLISSFTSGEGLVCRFTGPGIVLIQTRKPQGFGEWIRQFIPNK